MRRNSLKKTTNDVYYKKLEYNPRNYKSFSVKPSAKKCGIAVLYLHPSGSLQEWQELFAFVEISWNVCNPSSRNVFLVVKSLKGFQGLVLGGQKVVVVRRAAIVVGRIPTILN